MASQVRRQAGTIDRLLAQPEKFDFFQAVRLLERYFATHAVDTKLQFKSSPSLAFSPTDLLELQQEQLDKGDVVKLLVSFMGLIGQNGVLPEHYTELLLARIDQKDETFAAFLDIFHDRILRLFYQIWEADKYYVNFEKNSDTSLLDRTLQFVRAVSGQPPVPTDNATLDPDLWLFYSGLLGSQARSSEGLRLIIEDYFQVPTTVSNFGGQWERINQHECSALGNRTAKHNCLGVDAVVGNRVWHVQNKFEIQIGPVNYTTFKRLLPNGDMLQALRLLVQRFVGIEFDFSVSLLLKGASVPRCQVRHKNSMCLGWNSWLRGAKTFKRPAEVKLSNFQFSYGRTV